MMTRPFKQPDPSSIHAGRQRNGLSIIEVLVSMLVAMIGVFGVMIMIPFAVSQVEFGFDTETAMNLGRNAANEHEIKGFNSTNRWVVTRVPGAPVMPGIGVVRTYVIDPIAVADRVANGLDSGHFPFVHPQLEAEISPASAGHPIGSVPSADKSFLIERVNLLSNLAPPPPYTPAQLIANSFNRNTARFHFNWQSDLQFRNPTVDDVAGNPLFPSPQLAPPQQYFTTDDGTPATSLRRQIGGNYSHIVVAVPNDVQPTFPSYPADPESGMADFVTSFRNYFVVYKNRPLPVPLGTGREAFDRVYQVDTSMLAFPQSRINRAGGNLVITDNPLITSSDAMRISNLSSFQRADIRRGDWMALTNVVYNPSRDRFFQQTNFYQVLDASVENFADDSSAWNVTLQGPDFDFLQSSLDPAQNPNTFRAYASEVTAGGDILPSRTYAIHLPDVWAVFERTVSY